MRVFKAALTGRSSSSEKIIGFGVLHYQAGGLDEDSEFLQLNKTFVPQGMNGELNRHCWTSVMEKQKEHLEGRKHVD